MNLKNRMIMDEYRTVKKDYLQLGDIVNNQLKKLVKDNDIDVLAIEHRVKEEASLAGKLELKGDKYSDIEEITDILGARIICFFSDEVDKVAQLIEKIYDIDWDNSVDKRKLLKPDSFGYMSLHYICSLPFDAGYPENVCGKKFEIQIRSSLQHTWSAINHDLGYKSEFGVPKAIVREFSRIAGLLEIADEQFINIRTSMSDYCTDVRDKIANNEAQDISIDMISLREYVLHNKKMREFLTNLAKICNAEIREVNSETYVEQLAWLGKTTIGDLQEMLEDDKDLALALAQKSLAKADIDMLSTNVGLRFLCRAELLNKNYTLDQATEFITVALGNDKRAKRSAKHLFKLNDQINGVEA